MPPSLQDFIAKWKGSAGREEANSQSFLQDFYAALDLPAVDAKGFDSAYCFEMKIQLTHAEGRTSVGSADLFRAGCFVLEAKQASTAENPGSAPLRGTASYERYMERAFGQAVNYAQLLPGSRAGAATGSPSRPT